MKTYYWLSQLFLRLVLWALFGLKVKGRENIPRRGGVIIAALIRAYRAFPLKREGVSREAISWAIDLLRSGHALLLFPEGGRQRGGKLGSGRPGVGLIATRAGVPVIPALIQNSDHLRQALLRKRRLRISFGQPLRAEIGDYQVFAQQVMEKIGELRNSQQK